MGSEYEINEFRIVEHLILRSTVENTILGKHLAGMGDLRF